MIYFKSLFFFLILSVAACIQSTIEPSSESHMESGRELDEALEPPRESPPVDSKRDQQQSDIREVQQEFQNLWRKLNQLKRTINNLRHHKFKSKALRRERRRIEDPTALIKTYKDCFSKDHRELSLRFVMTRDKINRLHSEDSHLEDRIDDIKNTIKTLKDDLESIEEAIEEFKDIDEEPSSREQRECRV